MGTAHEVGIGDVVQEAGAERGRVVVVDAYRSIRVRDDRYGIGTGAQGGQALADGANAATRSDRRLAIQATTTVALRSLTGCLRGPGGSQPRRPGPVPAFQALVPET